MAKHNKHHIRIKKPDNFSQKASINVNIPEPKKPSIDFRFIFYSNHDLYETIDTIGLKNKQEIKNFFITFQTFIKEFSECPNISEAVKCYSSHNSGKKIKNNYICEIIERLPQEIQQIAKDELTHLHLKRNGKSKYVVWGFCNNDIFYILAIDPIHASI